MVKLRTLGTTQAAVLDCADECTALIIPDVLLLKHMAKLRMSVRHERLRLKLLAYGS